jgi:hypothetical protein
MIAPAAENPKPFVLPAIAEVGRHVSYQRLTALLLVATMFAC